MKVKLCRNSGAEFTCAVPGWFGTLLNLLAKHGREFPHRDEWGSHRSAELADAIEAMLEADKKITDRDRAFLVQLIAFCRAGPFQVKPDPGEHPPTRTEEPRELF